MNTFVKILGVCALCTGIIVALVYLIKWLF